MNTISPSIVMTMVAYDEFASPDNTYQHIIEVGACRRMGTPDELTAVSAFLLGPDATFITGTNPLVDGGTIAALRSCVYQGRAGSHK